MALNQKVALHISASGVAAGLWCDGTAWPAEAEDHGLWGRAGLWHCALAR